MSSSSVFLPQFLCLRPIQNPRLTASAMLGAEAWIDGTGVESTGGQGWFEAL